MAIDAAIRDISSRASRLQKALRSGRLTAGATKALDESYCYVYKDDDTPVLGMGRSGAAEPETADDETGVIWFTTTVLDEDRDGDVVVPSGRHGKNYEQNPVWFFGHQEWEIPVGSGWESGPGSRVMVEVSKDRLRQGCRFDREDPDADFLYGKVKRGMLNSTSIAFVPLVAHRRDEVEKARTHSKPGQPPGWYFAEWDHTETSIVGVPSNPGALRDDLDREKGFITPRLYKGLSTYAAKARGRCFGGWCPRPVTKGDAEGKPADCTCKDYPRIKQRNGSGHFAECPVHKRWQRAGGFQCHCPYARKIAKEPMTHDADCPMVKVSKSCGCKDCQAGDPCPCEKSKFSSSSQAQSEADRLAKVMRRLAKQQNDAEAALLLQFPHGRPQGAQGRGYDDRERALKDIQRQMDDAYKAYQQAAAEVGELEDQGKELKALVRKSGDKWLDEVDEILRHTKGKDHSGFPKADVEAIRASGASPKQAAFAIVRADKVGGEYAVKGSQADMESSTQAGEIDRTKTQVVTKPFAGYSDFDDCTSKNRDKRNPDAYCGSIQSNVEGKASAPGRAGGVAKGLFDDAQQAGMRADLTKDPADKAAAADLYEKLAAEKADAAKKATTTAERINLNNAAAIFRSRAAKYRIKSAKASAPGRAGGGTYTSTDDATQQVGPGDTVIARKVIFTQERLGTTSQMVPGRVVANSGDRLTVSDNDGNGWLTVRNKAGVQAKVRWSDVRAAKLPAGTLPGGRKLSLNPAKASTGPKSSYKVVRGTDGKFWVVESPNRSDFEEGPFNSQAEAQRWLDNQFSTYGGKKQLSEASGSAGGYTVASPQSPLRQQRNDGDGAAEVATDTHGFVLCADCDGTGNCPICGGDGLKADESNQPCSTCGGSGECPECAGVGSVTKSLTKAGNSVMPYRDPKTDLVMYGAFDSGGKLVSGPHRDRSDAEAAASGKKPARGGAAGGGSCKPGQTQATSGCTPSKGETMASKTKNTRRKVTKAADDDDVDKDSDDMPFDEDAETADEEVADADDVGTVDKDSMDEPFNPKPSAMVLAKLYKHLQEIPGYLENELATMDNADVAKGLEGFVDKFVSKASEYISSLLDKTHGNGEEGYMDKCMKAMEADTGGAGSVETGEENKVDVGEIPPDDEVEMAAPGTDEWAEEEMNEPEHKAEGRTDSSRDEIMERYQDAKGHWRVKTHRVRVTKGGQMYLVRTKGQVEVVPDGNGWSVLVNGKKVDGPFTDRRAADMAKVEQEAELRRTGKSLRKDGGDSAYIIGNGGIDDDADSGDAIQPTKEYGEYADYAKDASEFLKDVSEDEDAMPSKQLRTVAKSHGRLLGQVHKALTQAGKVQRDGGPGSVLSDDGKVQRDGGSGSALSDKGELQTSQGVPGKEIIVGGGAKSPKDGPDGTGKKPGIMKSHVGKGKADTTLSPAILERLDQLFGKAKQLGVIKDN